MRTLRQALRVLALRAHDARLTKKEPPFGAAYSCACEHIQDLRGLMVSGSKAFSVLNLLDIRAVAHCCLPLPTSAPRNVGSEQGNRP